MNEYLAEVKGERREPLAIRRLVYLEHYLEPIMRSLGMNLFSWYILEIEHKHLVKSFKGDVDILSGKLSWRDQKHAETVLQEVKSRNTEWPQIICEQIATQEIVEAGGLKWPPSIDYLVGIEAKCALGTPSKVKSTKSSKSKQKDIQDKINILLQMGFDKIALIDFIANPPQSGVDIEAWLAATLVANASSEKMKQQKALHAKDTVLNERLLTTFPSGHWLLSMGAVAGGDESIRGSGIPVELRKACENPMLQNSKTQEYRKEMETNLNSVFAHLPLPRSLPVVLVDCRTCRSIHFYNPEQDTCESH